MAGVEKICKGWIEHFIEPHPDLKSKLVNRIDRQRVLDGRPTELDTVAKCYEKFKPNKDIIFNNDKKFLIEVNDKK